MIRAAARGAKEITKVLCMRRSKKYVFAVVKEEMRRGDGGREVA